MAAARLAWRSAQTRWAKGINAVKMRHNPLRQKAMERGFDRRAQAGRICALIHMCGGILDAAWVRAQGLKQR